MLSHIPTAVPIHISKDKPMQGFSRASTQQIKLQDCPVKWIAFWNKKSLSLFKYQQILHVSKKGNKNNCLPMYLDGKFQMSFVTSDFRIFEIAEYLLMSKEGNGHK